MSMDVIEEGGSSSHRQADESSDQDGDDEEETIKVVNRKVEENKPNSIRSSRRPASLEVLNRVKINNTLETPRSTIKSLLRYPMQTELNFSRENLKKVEELLKRAFVEFYQKLRLLKSYR